MKREYQIILQKIRVAEQSLWSWSQSLKDYMRAMDDQFDPGHRLDHIERVLENALQLCIAENAILEVVVPAVWLHDCVPVAKHSPDRAKASRLSANRAEELLNEIQYPAKFIEPIKHAIACHSFSAGLTPESLEAKIVQDADRLDAIGAVGIARVFMVGGHHQNAIYHAEQPFPESREPDEKKYIVDHFYEKLLKLAPNFLTDAGREEAQQRTNVMRDYLIRLGHEIGVDCALALPTMA